jgi:hypothetical protein
MAKRKKKTKGKTMVYKTKILKKIKIEQHEHH